MSKFTFANSLEGFDSHISNSIRGYDFLWDDILKLSEYFVEDKTNVVDIGCSTGKFIKKMALQNNFCNCNYIGIEKEEDFHEDLLSLEDYNIEFFLDDVREFLFQNCSFITSIFTLQFLPIKDRYQLFQSVFNGLNSGGAFVFAEKIFSNNPRVQEMMTFLHYEYKRKNFSTDQILDKEKELRHMLKPNTELEISQMCAKIGFDITPFWRNHNFVGFICIK